MANKQQMTMNGATTATTPKSKKTHFFFPPLRQKPKRKSKRDTVSETQIRRTGMKGRTGMNRLWPLLQQEREFELKLW